METCTRLVPEDVVQDLDGEAIQDMLPQQTCKAGVAIHLIDSIE